MLFRFFSSRRRTSADPATAESILGAAATVLLEQGEAGFSAARVARAAGVSIATFRLHFADTAELLTEMIARDTRRRAELGLGWLKGPGPPATATVDQLVHGFVALTVASRRGDPVTAILRRLARTQPGLTAVDDAWHADWIPPFASFMRRRTPALSASRAVIAARFVATLHVFVVDFAIANPELEAAILAEWEPLLAAYFTMLARLGPENEPEPDEGAAP